MAQVIASTQRFASYEDTPEWAALARALDELAGTNRFLDIADRSYILGYLCEALRRGGSKKKKRSEEELRAILKNVQEAFIAHNPEGRDPMAELLAERREAGARGE